MEKSKPIRSRDMSPIEKSARLDWLKEVTNFHHMAGTLFRNNGSTDLGEELQRALASNGVSIEKDVLEVAFGYDCNHKTHFAHRLDILRSVVEKYKKDHKEDRSLKTRLSAKFKS